MTSFSDSVVCHPLLQHKISAMREERCRPREFGQLLRDCGILLGYEATRDLEVTTRRVQTPRAVMDDAPMIAEADPVIVAVLRAGLVMAEGLRDIFHTCSVGHIGLSRYGGSEPENSIVRYYSNLPLYSGQRFFIVDPVVATGSTMAAAIDIVKENGVPDRAITAIALLGAKSGVEALARRHPGVRLYLGACDPELDSHRFVVPGVGDMGDRLFGTT